ncbi:MAG: hypothetical protein Kow0079_01820 [Vicingaceae bacterium]
MKKYKNIVKHYENCLSKHGDTHLGVDWPNEKDVYTRFDIMLDLIRVNKDNDKKVTLLDFGCGTAHLLDYINKKSISNLDYYGLDISKEFIDVAQKKYPEITFYCLDIFDDDAFIPNFDYIILNGVFTIKKELSFKEMWDYFSNSIKLIYSKCNKGMAFNVMSKQVDWEREDLFHVPFDKLSDFLCKNITRKFIFRNDYGLYEFTTYVLK